MLIEETPKRIVLAPLYTPLWNDSWRRSAAARYFALEQLIAVILTGHRGTVLIGATAAFVIANRPLPSIAIFRRNVSLAAC